MTSALKAIVYSPFVSQEFVMLMAAITSEDLAVLSDLMQKKKVTPVIDRTYPLAEVPTAIRYLENGRARGKVIIVVAEDGSTVPTDPPAAGVPDEP